ncbi:MAG: hypothetical protein Q7U42_04375 [Parvibaculum sp.]|nr:hypothetical protein [Parvibaculum sp.]
MIAKLGRGLECELAHIASTIKHLGRNRFNSHIRPVSAALPQAFLVPQLYAAPLPGANERPAADQPTAEARLDRAAGDKLSRPP